MKVDETINVVDKHDEKMRTHDNWAHGVRATGKHEKNNKKIELFVRIRTSVQSCRLKQKVRNACEDERVWIE